MQAIQSLISSLEIGQPQFEGGLAVFPLFRIDVENFLGKLLALDEARQYTIRKLVTEGDYTTPTCPSCGDGTKMRLRVAKKDDSRFWGCSRFPECKSTMRVGRAEAGLTA